jgi:hypothetical protein
MAELKDYLVALRAAIVINAASEALDAILGVAGSYLNRGMTQEAANLLAFIINHPDVLHDTFDRAEDLFLDLEERLCPRVILDAKTFAVAKSINTIAHYIFEISPDA